MSGMLRPFIGPEEIRTIETLEHVLHCPRCAANLNQTGFSSAYWQADAIVYFCWCGVCGWLGDISEFTQITSYEPDENEDEWSVPQLEVVRKESS
jgi:hypothetical protein